MDLFLDTKLKFEKLGMEIRLEEDPNDWPRHILDELYRQAPFTSDYAPKVILRDIDTDRRYAMGHIELLNKLAINPRDDSTPKELKGKHKVVVPIVIKDGKLLPLDLLMNNGAAEPLTEERLREALFRPSLFEAIRKRPGDLSMIEQLYPPYQQNTRGRGAIVSDGGMARTASVNKEAGFSHVTTKQWDSIYDDPKVLKRVGSIQKKHKIDHFGHPEIDSIVMGEAQKRYGMGKKAEARPEFLMDAILPTIKKAHVETITQQLNASPSLRAAVFSNESAVPFMSKLAEVESFEQDIDGGISKIAKSLVPNVMQVQKIDGGMFRVKTAQSSAIIPDAEDMDRPTAVGALGGDLVSKVEQDGTATITTLPNVKETLVDLEITVVKSFGLYKVRTQGENRELVGWVFPKVMAFTGEVLPMAVFSNGSESAMQENIAGVPVARQTDVLDAPPSGTGCFYQATSSGAQALVPVTVKSEVESPEGTSYICETVLGESCTLVKLPGLKNVQLIEEGRYGMPEDIGFMPLENEIDLASSPDAFTKVAQAQRIPKAVRILTDGSYFSFEGAEIDKLAGVMETKFLNKDDTIFLGALLGQEPEKLAHDLVAMRKAGSHEIWVDAKPIETFKSKYAGGVARAREMLDRLPNLRVDLLKEAAPIEDPTSVDKILSVGFINPENISIFASYVPEIEVTIKKLSELLLASRLGLSSVNQGAVQKALVHLDKVVAGLKTLGATAQA